MSKPNISTSRKISFQQLTPSISNLFNPSLGCFSDSSGSKSSHYITESGNNHLSLHDSLDHELDEAVFDSRSVLDHYCPVERTDVDNVMCLLESRYGMKHDSIIASCSTGGNFSPLEGGFGSLANLFSSILSRIISACKMQLGAKLKEKNLMNRMRFVVREPNPQASTNAHSHSMVLGTVEDEEIDWCEAPLCLLLHRSWSLLHSHGTIYARNRFSSNKTKEWVPIIFVMSDMDDVQVEIGIYTRSGLFKTEPLRFLSSTPPLKPYDWKAEYRPTITQEQAFRKFVRGIVGLYNVEYTKAGVDITRHPSSPHIILPQPLGLGVIKEVHCERQCVKGRATRVYTVQQEDPAGQTGVLAELEKALTINSIIQEEPPNHALSPHMTSAHDKWAVVIKDCWPCASENNELTMFQSLNGQFGLPVLLHGYHVMHNGTCSPEQTIVPNDGRFWKPESPEAKVTKPSERIHKRLVFKTLGRPLLTARSPKELLRVVTHAILGHYNMFQHGWLHCDVSVGNVLIMDPPEVRSPVTDFEFTKFISKCEGFLTDGDQAICREGTEGIYEWTASGRPKGTPTFMSQHLIKAWNSGRQVYHTAVDDLESFVWVFVWAVFEILRARRITLHPLEETFMTFMSSRNLSSILCRMDIADYVRRSDVDASSGLEPFIPLLRNWFRHMVCADEKREMLVHSRPLVEKMSICKEIYEGYLRAAFDSLEELPHVWEMESSVSLEDLQRQ